MSERATGQLAHVDRQYLLSRGVLPGVATLGAMLVAFLLVSGVLLARETLIVGSIWTRILALALMYLVPQFAVGAWMGVRYGAAVAPAVAAGVAPILALVVALGLFGGPLLTPLETPLLVLAAVLVWTGVAACGLVVGENVLAPRLRKWRN